MKIRIQDNSIRFRISLRELEKLQCLGRLMRETFVPSANGMQCIFRYEVRRVSALAASEVRLEPFSITLLLCNADFDELASPHNDGAYIRREWSDNEGAPQRFMAFIEKDRPSSTTARPEAWIYEYNHNQTSQSRVNMMSPRETGLSSRTPAPA